MWHVVAASRRLSDTAAYMRLCPCQLLHKSRTPAFSESLTCRRVADPSSGSDPLCVFRIQRSGGSVTWNSVGQANVNGRLAMTRSIGDFHLKTSGVIAEPDTWRVTVSLTFDPRWP